MFCSVVTATRCIGEFTWAPFAGLETQTEPADVVPGFGGGTGEGEGNGATPEVGPWLITDWTVGHVLAAGGVGEGGVGEVPGVVGVGVLAFGESPQPMSIDKPTKISRVNEKKR